MSRLSRTSAGLTLFAALSLAGCEAPLKPTGLEGVPVLEKLGLLGRWAFDCAVDASRENPTIVYAVNSAGVASEQFMARDPRLDRNTPLSGIMELEGGHVQWSQKAGSSRVTVILKVEGARQRTWSAVLADGSVFVSGGQFNGGRETPWFNKCAGG